MTQKRNQTIVKITLPELDRCDVNVLQAIFDKYDAEMIEKDLFIKVSFISSYISFKEMFWKPEHEDIDLNLTTFYIRLTEDIRQKFN